MTTHLNPTVHILLATHQGAKHLREQLDSIAAQSYQNWSLTISDDGSTDDTVQIARDFASEQAGRSVVLLAGPKKQSTANFFHLLHAAPTKNSADLYAFCDQDDVWLPDKLRRAVNWLTADSTPQALPLLYCARTQLVDEQCHPIGLSAAPTRPLTFGNALLQNIASGNTMVFNQCLLNLLRKIPTIYSVWHDWTAYQVVTGCGGTVFYDLRPALLYRQHEANVIGAKRTSLDQLKRARLILQGRYYQWSEKTESALKGIEQSIIPTAMQQLTQFRVMRRSKTPLTRLACALRNRNHIYRQTKLEQIGFLLAVSLKLI
jgi:glycosyltransferase involved in cell wall biosynthesis